MSRLRPVFLRSFSVFILITCRAPLDPQQNGVPVAFLYSHDSATADAYAALLDGDGFETDLIEIAPPAIHRVWLPLVMRASSATNRHWGPGSSGGPALSFTVIPIKKVYEHMAMLPHARAGLGAPDAPESAPESVTNRSNATSRPHS